MLFLNLLINAIIKNIKNYILVYMAIIPIDFG